MEHDFLVFYRVVTSNEAHVKVIRVAYPPHEKPRGTILIELLYEALGHPAHRRFPAHGTHYEITGYVELPNAVWNQHAEKDIGLGDGRHGSIHSTPDGWRVDGL